MYTLDFCAASSPGNLIKEDERAFYHGVYLTEYSRVLHGTPEYFRVLHGTPEYSIVLHGTPEYSIVLPSTP